MLAALVYSRRRRSQYQRSESIHGKRSVYCVTLRDSCVTVNGGETDLDACKRTTRAQP